MQVSAILPAASLHLFFTRADETICQDERNFAQNIIITAGNTAPESGKLINRNFALGAS